MADLFWCSGRKLWAVGCSCCSTERLQSQHSRLERKRGRDDKCCHNRRCKFRPSFESNYAH